ncbi:hypothetical protein JOC94_001081 [Bacillus thermophilus]|uniref:UPF0311 protein JOC94_001081 n=1 Tax=Siminovitchia thermophila TaxID=1245522 RepID=A0ABS2R4L1_9BACI|nr:DUF3237 domain-containing protein [Siminovitchia thermophila]MBM7714109.1 hypothetical protein [Siminovitchia thermophila]ONK21699.1 hypothetical protein BLX87_21025 [Bacillus sp. VT-16-64]
MKHLPAPALSFLCDMELTVEGPHLPGKTPIGNRRIIRVTGGALRGDKLTAEVIPGGDDWITVRDDGTIIQDVRILLKTDDGELILMMYRGIRTGEPEVLQRLDNNEQVDPDEYYFRTAPIFETASSKYDWLNRRLFISRGIRLPGKVNYSIYVVD